MKKIIALALYVAFLLAVIFFSISCNPAKHEQRLDIKAFNRVNAKFPLFDSTGRRWILQFPCANDSTVTYIKGDTLVFSDTTYIVRNDTSTICELRTKVITKTVRIHDTLKISVKDVQELNLVKGDKDLAIKQAISYLNRAIDAEEKADDYRRDRNMWKVLFIGLVTLLVGIFIYKLWPKPTDLTKGIKLN